MSLLACSSHFGTPTTGKGYRQSGVTGQVNALISFHAWNLLFTSSDGQFVTKLLTDGDGSFEVDLKPGKYVLVAYITNVGPSYPVLWGASVVVTVEKKRFATAVLPISLPPI